MSLELCILASGSSGNASLLRTPTGVMLIDAGIGPRTTAKRLTGTGVTLNDITSIVLTHLDSDHFTPSWFRTIERNGIRVFCHGSRFNQVRAQAGTTAGAVHAFNGAAFSPLDGLQIRALPLAHDETGSHGFVIEGFSSRIGYATDLGHVPHRLFAHFHDLDVLALESNYDPQMQLTSARPVFLKQRIMGGRGHLSNAQALAAIQRILDRAQASNTRLPSHIVLLHRSRQCNCPKLVHKLFSKDNRIASRLSLAHQYERTEWLRPRAVKPSPQEQLTLGWT